MIEGFEDREAFFASPDDRFLDVAKECSEAVEVLHGDRVVFVVMALRAGDGLTEPDRADGPNAIGQHAGFVVLVLCATLFGAEDQAIEGRSDAGFLVRIGQEISGYLFERESVEGLIGIERSDDVIAIGPNVARIVAVVTDRVGKADDVEPSDGHPFAEVRIGEQRLDQIAVGLLGGICDKGVHDFRARGQSDQIVVKPTDQRARVGLLGGL